MLYVLPPPRAPDPPSPWDSILCAGGNSNNGSVSERPPWADIKQMPMKPPPGSKVLNLKLKSRANDPAKTVPNDKDDSTRGNKSLSECYFAGKGTALVLPPHERLRPKRRSSAQGSDIQQHLQSMFYLLRPEETLKMAVKLESVHPYRTRYLVVVSCMGRQEAEESCLLGIDCNERTTIGLVLRVLADTTITLDGDGGFSVTVCGRHHIFKPVSVQAMWSALQSLHKISSKAREQNYFQGGPTHDWVNYYDERIESDRSCLNEWHAMDSLESRRPPSPDSIRTKPREREEAEMIIRATLKEIMMSVDLDEVTSKCIRNRLEEDLNMNLGEFKSFIDQEMLTILGQMDAPTEIFDHVYLGSEWNASNFEELQKNGVGHILNVTREIDNFFPGMFDYLNIRVYDDEKTDLLKYWDNTYKYITKARKEGSKVLVHCKMGVSRSASVVIAYAMKAYNWNFEKALKHVKEKRSCIKPNTSFIAQLETYQGILDAMKNKEKLQRSKSETNLKSPETIKSDKKVETDSVIETNVKMEAKSLMSGRALKQIGVRPKSWSPDNQNSKNLLLEQCPKPAFLSLENLSKSVQPIIAQNQKTAVCNHVENARNVLMPFNNGQSYSVSPNQIVHIPGNCKKQREITKPSFSCDSTEPLEYKCTATKEKKGMVLNLTTQFEGEKSKPSSPTEAQYEESRDSLSLNPAVHNLVSPDKDIWDPGEPKTCYCNSINVNTGEDVVWTSSAVLRQTVTDNSALNHNIDMTVKPTPDVIVDSNISKVIVRKEGDPFSSRLDRVFDREERKQQRNSVICPPPADSPAEETMRKCPSRQSSWSSYDSAVVLGSQGEARDTPSRHSSWGSGDTRTLPSRNSSWGSYDMRRGQIGHVIAERDDKTSEILSASSSGMFPYDKDEIPWYPGTVKRTKQKLESNSETNKRVCSVPKNLDNSGTTGSLINVQTNKSPSIETLSDFPISNLSNHTKESYKNGIMHYQSSPVLCSPKKSSENFPKVKSKEIDIISDPHVILSNESRLSVSAPGSSSLSVIVSDFVPLSSSSTSDKGGINKKPLDCSFISQYPTHKNKSSDTLNKSDSFVVSSVSEPNSSCIQGIVKNLKKEFEAKTHIQSERLNGVQSEKLPEHEQKDKSTQSVTVSPKNSHEDLEDISVRELVGKYESEKSETDLQESPTFRPKSNCIYNNKNVRYSCIEVLSDAQDKESYNTIIPSTLVYSEPETNKVLDMRPKKPHPGGFSTSTVVKAAAKKQQLQTRNRDFHTSYKMRNNHPAHNTM